MSTRVRIFKGEGLKQYISFLPSLTFKTGDVIFGTEWPKYMTKWLIEREEEVRFFPVYVKSDVELEFIREFDIDMKPFNFLDWDSDSWRWIG